MKALLYCTKKTSYLVKDDFPYENEPIYFTHYTEPGSCGLPLNGKIVAICDIETNEIENSDLINKLTREELLNKSCLTEKQLSDYLNFNNEPIIGYALYISNLKPFKKLKKLNDYVDQNYHCITRAPQNMMYVYDESGNEYALISIHSKWLCKILNGKKTIEVRRKVLKEMFEK